MKKESIGSVFLAVSIGALACSDVQGPGTEVSESFTGVNVLAIHQAQGETRIQPADGDAISVTYSYTYPQSCHQPGLTLVDDSLDVRGIFEPVACSGRADILIELPDGVTINYHGAQANLVLDGITAEIDAYAGRGIVGQGLALTGESQLWATDDDLEISLGQTPTHDLILMNRDGNVTLNAAGNLLRGQFEFRVNEAEGEIRSPYPFDEESRYDCECEPGVTWWLRKVFTLSQDEPHFTLSSRNGVAELRLQ
ncbi:MAG: hypothetical protein ACYSUI_17100 [Planctomycetota bacterium]